MKATENTKLTLALRPVDRGRLAELGIRFLMSAALGRARLLGSWSPFGAAFTGASGGGAEGFAALAGVCLGALTAGRFSWSVKYIAISVLIWATLHFFARALPGWAPMAVTGGMTCLIGSVFAWDSGWEVTATAMWVVESALAGGLVWFYASALSPAEDTGERELRASRAASLTLLAASLLMALASPELLGVLSPGRTGSVLVILAVTLRGGMGPGCVCAAALGAAMDLAQGGTPFFTLSYTLAALISGVFSKSGRLPIVLSWSAASALSIIWFWSTAHWLPAAYETFAAGVIFMLIPDRALARLAALVPSDIPGYGFLRAREYTRDRMDRCAAALRSLGDAPRRPDPRDTPLDTARLFDRASEAVCRSCPGFDRCWRQEYPQTLELLGSLTPILTSRGRVDLSQLPPGFADRCPRHRELLESLNSETRSALSRRQFDSLLRESRAAALSQYSDMSALLASLASELGEEIAVEPELEQRLRKYLRSLAIDASAAVFRLPGGRLRAEIRSQSLELLRRDPKWLDRLSQVLETRLCTSPRECEDRRLVLLQAEPLAVRVGSASEKRDRESVSGDRFSYFRTDEGILYALLSDGMGTGPEAAKMASEVSSCLERLLMAGISPELALRLTGGGFALREDGELRSATVDLLRIDMFTGQANLYKCGAAPSYVKTGPGVRRLTSPSLPLGPAAAAVKPIPVPLSPGSVVVLVSDGVADPANDRWLRQTVTANRSQDPATLARTILTHPHSPTPPADDMTVLTLKIEERS